MDLGSILFISLSAIVFFYLGYLFNLLKNKSKAAVLVERIKTLERHSEVIKSDLQNRDKNQEELRTEKENISIKYTKLQTEHEFLKEEFKKRQTVLNEERNKMYKDFEIMASKLLEDKTKKFTLQNSENIKSILDPLEEKIKTFGKKVEDTQKENISIHSALKEQLHGLKDLNQQMSLETKNLTKALKGDSKAQGNWGEVVLERVLEKSGLEKNREYFIQQSFTNEDGKRVLPDVVLHLPENKKMIVDSKVSITDYTQYVNSNDTKEQEVFLKKHVKSIKTHIDQLSEKNYQDIYDIESPDFVLMFIPIEPAFAIALNLEPNLYNKAFEQNIVIVTPSTLLATLRTIDSMWNNEKHQQNAIEIARQAGALYDKFDGLVKDLTGIGKKIDAAKTDYSSAMNKLVEGSGNLVKRVENLKKMGAKAKKSLPESIIKRARESDD